MSLACSRLEPAAPPTVPDKRWSRANIRSLICSRPRDALAPAPELALVYDHSRPEGQFRPSVNRTNFTPSQYHGKPSRLARILLVLLSTRHQAHSVSAGCVQQVIKGSHGNIHSRCLRVRFALARSKMKIKARYKCLDARLASCMRVVSKSSRPHPLS